MKRSDTMRALWVCAIAMGLLLGCGGAEPRAEATWETHTIAPDEGEEPAEGEADAP